MAGSTGQMTQLPAKPGSGPLKGGPQPSTPLASSATPAKSRHHFQWTGFEDKTLWDWLQLLGTVAIPIVVVFVSVWYSHDLQIARDQQQQAAGSTLDQQRQTTYDIYLDRMSDLITSQQLQTSKPEDEVRALARARTLAALKALDPVRKGQLLVFLYDAHLIGKNAIVDLSDADLSGADLHDVVLSGADLSGIYLHHANLSNAKLNDTKLINAELSGANLSGAELSGTYLSGANLSGAELSNAELIGAYLSIVNLSDADLRGAKNLTDEQLKAVGSLRGATMPDGSKHP